MTLAKVASTVVFGTYVLFKSNRSHRQLPDGFGRFRTFRVVRIHIGRTNDLSGVMKTTIPIKSPPCSSPKTPFSATLLFSLQMLPVAWSFAVRFHLAEHVHTDIVAHSVDSFPTRTADEFLEFINALVATDPAGPHPNAIERFLGKHPAALAFCGLSRQHSTLPRDANLVVRPMNNSGRGPITHLKAIGHLQADATESV